MADGGQFVYFAVCGRFSFLRFYLRVQIHRRGHVLLFLCSKYILLADCGIACTKQLSIHPSGLKVRFGTSLDFLLLCRNDRFSFYRPLREESKNNDPSTRTRNVT